MIHQELRVTDPRIYSVRSKFYSRSLNAVEITKEQRSQSKGSRDQESPLRKWFFKKILLCIIHGSKISKINDHTDQEIIRIILIILSCTDLLNILFKRWLKFIVALIEDYTDRSPLNKIKFKIVFKLMQLPYRLVAELFKGKLLTRLTITKFDEKCRSWLLRTASFCTLHTSKPNHTQM